MHLVLIYRPEVAGSDQNENGPFGGIEIGFVSLDEEDCLKWVEDQGIENPHWHFCVMPVK